MLQLFHFHLVLHISHQLYDGKPMWNDTLNIQND